MEEGATRASETSEKWSLQKGVGPVLFILILQAGISPRMHGLSFISYILSTNCIPGTLLGTGEQD